MPNLTAHDLLIQMRQMKQGTPVVDASTPSMRPKVGTEQITAKQILQSLQPLKHLGGTDAEQVEATRDVSSDVPGAIKPQSAILAEAEKLPEIARERFFEDVGTTAALLFSANDDAKIDIIKEKYNLTDKNIRRDKKTGVTIVDFPDGKSQVLNRPGASFQDFVNFAGLAAANIPSIVAASAIPGGWAAKMAYEGLGGGLTEYAIQKGEQLLGSKQPMRPIDIGLAGVTGAVGKGVELGAKGFAARGLRKRTGVEDVGDYTAFPEAVKKSEEIAEALRPYGQVGTFRAQKTGYIKDEYRARYAATMSEEAQRRLMKQNREVKELADNFIQSISPANTYPEAAGRIRGAAQKMIKTLEKERGEAAEKLYNQATAEPGKFVMPETIKKIDSILADYPKAGRPRQLERIRSMLTVRTKTGEQPAGLTLKQLHKVKAFRLEDYIQKADPKNRIELNSVKESLLDEIESISPKYKEAREAYANLSAPIDEARQSLIGDIAQLKDKQLKTLQNIIANPSDYQVNPREIDRIRRAFKSEDPAGWQSFVGSIFDNKIMTKMQALTEEELFNVENKPGQIYRALVGRGGKEKKLMMSLLEGEQKKNFSYFLEGLKNWQKGRPGGSQTEFMRQITKEAKEYGGISRKIISGFTPRKAVQEAAEEAGTKGYVRAMTTALFDPKWAPKMRDLRKLDPGSRGSVAKFEKIITEILTTTAKASTQAARPRLQD
jgi:hypothetical protein